MISFRIILGYKTRSVCVPRDTIISQGADIGLKVGKMCRAKRYKDDMDLLTIRALHVTVTVTNAVLNGHKK